MAGQPHRVKVGRKSRDEETGDDGIDDDHAGKPNRWRGRGFDDRRRAAGGRRRQLSDTQSGPAGRDRRPRTRRRPRPARRRGVGGAAGSAGVASAQRRRASCRFRSRSDHGRRAAGRTGWRAAVHPRARQGAQRGEFRDQHRTGTRRTDRVDGRGGARARAGRPAMRPTRGCTGSRSAWRRSCCPSTGRSR